MAVGKIIQFPVPEEYTWFLQDSEARLQVLLEALNMAHEKGYLDKRTFQGLIDYCGIDLYKDLSYIDRRILQFHITNYYALYINIC